MTHYTVEAHRKELLKKKKQKAKTVISKKERKIEKITNMVMDIIKELI